MVAAVGRKIAKEHRARQIPHGKQTVKQLMRHGVSTNSLELSGDTKSFDRVARKWNVDYAFYKTCLLYTSARWCWTWNTVSWCAGPAESEEADGSGVAGDA